MAPSAVFECRDEDPFVQVRHGARCAQCPEQAEDPGAAADLGGAGRAALDVGGQPRGVARLQLVEQERVDQVAGARTVQGMVAERVRHILYMTRGCEKVAAASNAAPLGRTDGAVYGATVQLPHLYDWNPRSVGSIVTTFAPGPT